MAKGSIYSLVVVDDKNGKHLIRFIEENTGKISEKAMLAQIDAVTANCVDMAEFMTLLNKQVHFNYVPVKCYIEYEATVKNRNGESERAKKKKDLIFNNQLILRAAYNFIKRKAHGQSNVDDQLPAITATLKTIKARAMHGTYGNYILKNAPYAIKEKLEEYVRAVTSNSLEYYKELQDIDRSLRSRLTTYSNFRDTQLVLMEIDRREEMAKTKEVAKRELAEQITILDIIEKEKMAATNITDEDLLEEYNKDILENEEELRKVVEENKRKLLALNSTNENEFNFIEDPYIRELYIETSGDIEAIKNILEEEKIESISEIDQNILGINKGLVR